MSGLRTIEELQDLEELCDYCPLPTGSNEIKCYGGQPISCEGSRCEEAYDNYVEEWQEAHKVHYLTSKEFPPMQHQRDCFYKLYDLDFAGIFGEQGTGKTRMSIDIVSNHFAEGTINAVLLIAPKGVHEQWYTDEIPKHSPVETDRFLWLAKSGKKYLADRDLFIKLRTKKLKWFCVNVDLFSTDNNIFLIRDFLKRHNTAIIVDESTRIKNPTANRTYNIMYNLAQLQKQGRAITKVMPYSKKRYILTGMQVTNSPYDLWSPFNFLSYDFFGTNFYGFKAKYGIEVGDKNSKTGQRYNRRISPKEIASILSYYRQGLTFEQVHNIMGIGERNVEYICLHPQIKFPYKHLDELKEKIEPFSFTIRKKDCLDLPPQTYQKIIVEPSAEQKRVYKELEKKLITEYNGQELSVKNKLALIVRLQQITSGFFPYDNKELDGETGEYVLIKKALPIGKKNPKIEAVKSAIDENIGETIFIACKFVSEIKLLQETLKKAYPDLVIASYYGAVPDKQRAIIANDFKAGMIDILIMNIRMAIGFNFQEVCHNAWAFSGTYSLEDRKQWEDRIHRIGQVNPVSYIDFIMKGTVDVKINKAIEMKVALLDYFRDHSVKEFLL